MIFEIGNLRVRKLSNKDTDYLVQWLSNPLVLQYYAGRDRLHNIEMVREKKYLRNEYAERFSLQF